MNTQFTCTYLIGKTKYIYIYMYVYMYILGYII